MVIIVHYLLYVNAAATITVLAPKDQCNNYLNLLPFNVCKQFISPYFHNY